MNPAAASLETGAARSLRLSEPSVPAEVRALRSTTAARRLEKLKRPDERWHATRWLVKEFATPITDVRRVAHGWLLTRRNTAEDRRRALGLYLDLAHKAKDAKVVEESSYFAAQVSLLDGRHEESANLFLALRTKFPDSPRVTESALAAAWANYYAGRYKEASDLLDRVIGQAQHPDREEILYVKANCLRQLEQRADAVTMYARQLTEFPAGKMAPLAHYERLSTLYNDGKYQEVWSRRAGCAPPPTMRTTSTGERRVGGRVQKRDRRGRTTSAGGQMPRSPSSRMRSTVWAGCCRNRKHGSGGSLVPAGVRAFPKDRWPRRRSMPRGLPFAPRPERGACATGPRC
jgi:hypothetical protein